MKHVLMAAALMLAAGSAQAQTVEVAEGDWSNIPRMELKRSPLVSGRAVEQMHQIARDRACSVPGLAVSEINLNVPFMIRFSPEGEVERVVLKRLGCPQLESILGGILLRMAKGGTYRPAEENQERWYRSELSFVSR